MNKNTRTVLLALATSAAVAVPLAGYAFAQNAPAARTTLAQTQTGQNPDTEAGEAPEMTLKGSVQLPAEQPGTEVPDAQEDAQYRSLAKITPAQAQQAAQAAVPGTVISVKLEDEDGSLVYAVVIGQTEIKVDAGNGQVLHQEAADTGNETGETEQEGTEQGETGN
jgi:uncharacterized membrane protein YkoI